MILLIDNYDSFSYNLYQMIGVLDPDIKVIRNDGMTVDEVRRSGASAVILSPGPGRPEEAGICVELVRELGPSTPILGVCLGCQAICAAWGATVSYAKRLMHGKQSRAELDAGSRIFAGLPPEVPVARYHSLAALEETMPACLRITARADDGEIMAVEHRDYPTYGLQFHPESVMTPDGGTMLKNFLLAARG